MRDRPPMEAESTSSGFGKSEIVMTPLSTEIGLPSGGSSAGLARNEAIPPAAKPSGLHGYVVCHGLPRELNSSSSVTCAIQVTPPFMWCISMNFRKHALLLAGPKMSQRGDSGTRGFPGRLAEWSDSHDKL